MHLPPEIIAEIVSHLAEPSRHHLLWDRHLPDKNFDWDSLIQCTGGTRRFISAGREFDSHLYTLRAYVKTLLNLRLVSRAWHVPATALLRRHHWLSIKFDSLDSLAKAIRGCKSDIQAEKLPLAPLIRKLDMPQIDNALRFERHYKPFPGEEDMDADDDDPAWLQAVRGSYDDELLPHVTAIHYETTKELEILREIFENVDHIEAFSIRFPIAVTYYQTPVCYAECYDMQALSDLTATLEYAFGLPAFEHLIDVRICMPSTWYVGHLLGHLSQRQRDGLRHLYVEIVDETGQCGSHDYSRYENVEYAFDGFMDDLVLYPLSNVQWEYPNRECQKGLWDFVSSCPNLESLGIRGTHFLDLEKLIWPRDPTSRGLRTIYLERIWATVPSIISLIRPHSSMEEPPQLRRIVFNDVKLKQHSDPWRKVFKFLTNRCPELQFCHLFNLSYFSNHGNFEMNPRPWEISKDIGSVDRRDVKAMFYMAKRMFEKAGGEECFPGCLDSKRQVERLGGSGMEEESEDEEV